MATQRDLFILDVKAPEFTGLHRELKAVESGLKGVATSFAKAFSTPEANAALSKNLTLMAATAQQVNNLTKAQQDLAASSGKVGLGAAAVNLNDYAAQLDRTLSLVRELRAEYQVTGKSTKELDRLINQIGNLAKGSLGALGRAAGKGDAGELLRKLAEDAKKARFELAQLDKEQQKVASRAAKQQEMTDAVQRTGRAASEAAAQFRALGLRNLGVEQATAAYQELLKIFSQFSRSSADQAKIGQQVADSYRKQAQALEELSKATDTQVRTQAKLRQAAAELAARRIDRGRVGSQEGVAAVERVQARIDKGELTSELQIARALTAETAAQRRNKEAISQLASARLNALSQEKDAEARIQQYVIQRARATGADVKLKGDLRAVLAEVTAAARAAGAEITRDARAIDALIQSAVAGRAQLQAAAPKALNEFGIAFATGFAAQGIAQTLGGAIAKVREFEDSLINVRRTANATRDTMNALGNEILNIGQRVPIAAKQLADAAGALGQVGAINFDPSIDYAENSKEIRDASKAIELVAQVSQVAGAEINTVATSYGQLSNIFSKDVERINATLARQGVEVVGVSNAMQYLFGAINQVENATVATTQDLLDFTLRFGAVASSVGITAENVIGLGGALRNFGVSTEVAGTAMTRFFSRATEDAESFGRVLGISGEQFRAAFATDALGSVMRVFKELNRQTATNKLALQDFLGALNVETRERNAVTKLIEGFDKLPDFINLATDAQKNYTSVATESEKKGETFSASLIRLGNAFLAVLDKGRPLLDLLGQLVTKLAAIIKAFSETGIAGAVVVIGGISAAVAFLVLKFVSLVQQIRLATQGLAAMGLQAKELAAAMQKIPPPGGTPGAPATAGRGAAIGAAAVGAVATAGAVALFSGSTVDEMSKEANAAGKEVGSSFASGVGSVTGTVVEYGLYAAVFAGFTALASKIGALIASSGLWAALGTAFSTGLAGLGTLIASVGAALFSPIVIAAGVVAAAIAAPFAAEALVVRAQAQQAEQDVQRMVKRQEIAARTFAALRAETEATTTAIGKANQEMQGLAQGLAIVAENAEKSQYATLSLSQVMAKLGKTKDLETAADLLKEVETRADAAAQGIAKAQETTLAAYGDYVRRIQKLTGDASLRPTAIGVDSSEDAVRAETEKIRKALQDREAAIRAQLKANRQQAGALIKESDGDTADIQPILDVLARQAGKLQGQLQEVRAAQKELEEKVVRQVADALGVSENAARDAIAKVREQARRTESIIRRQAERESERAIRDVAGDLTKFLTAADDVSSEIIAELEQKRNDFVSRLQKALEREGLTSAQRNELISLLDKVTGEAFLQKAQDAIGKALRERVTLKLTEIKDAVDAFFEGAELDQRLKDFEERVARTQKQLKLDTLSDQIEDLNKQKGKLDDLTEAFGDLEELRLSGVSDGLRNTESAIAALSAPTLKYLDTIDKLVLAFTGLEDSSINAYKAIKEGAEGAKRAAQQQAFDVGRQAGADIVAGRQQASDAGAFLRQSSTARSLVGQINAIRRQGGDEAEQGKKVGEAIAKAQEQLRKQGRADDPQAKAFFDRLNSELSDLFTDPERTSPEEELRKSVESVGAQTNTLLTSIDASLKALSKGQAVDTEKLRTGIAERTGPNGRPTGSSAAIEGSRARGASARAGRAVEAREAEKTALEREIQRAERSRSREREVLDQQRTRAGLLIDTARRDITGQVGREGAISPTQEAAIRKRIQELLNSREFAGLRSSLGEQAFGKLRKLEGPDRDFITERLRSGGLEQRERLTDAESKRLLDSANLTGQAGDRAASAIERLVSAVETSNQTVAERFAAIEKTINDAKLAAGTPR